MRLVRLKLTEVMKGKQEIDYFPDHIHKLQDKLLKPLENKGLTPEDVMTAVSLYTCISEEDIRSKWRKREIVYPRHLYCYLSDEMTNAYLGVIAEYVHILYKHSSVLHGIRTIRNLMTYDKKVIKDVAEIKQMLTKQLESLKS